jgi:ABC-type amino acid transport substrate-binding protein
VVSDAVGWSSLFVSANLQQHYHFLGDVAGHKIGVQAGYRRSPGTWDLLSYLLMNEIPLEVPRLLTTNCPSNVSGILCDGRWLPLVL